MLLLTVYVLIALCFSFLCSVAEAVLLSVSPAHIAIMKENGEKSAGLLEGLKEDINKPLSAILTLNTISHTIGAAGAGAQATQVFGNAYLGVFSAVLTILILVFSEIIPKTLGAHYWRQLAPATAYCLKYLIKVLKPFIWMSEKLTKGMSHGPTLTGFSRDEFAVMADLGVKDGQLNASESSIMKNLLLLNKTHVRDAMTPMAVVFSLSKDMRVEEFFHKYDYIRFSRIPIYSGDVREIIGFVLRSDLLLAQARGNADQTLENYSREFEAVLDYSLLSNVFEGCLRRRTHIMLVVDEYGENQGILTLEDVLETLLGMEIMDESDKEQDMQALAKRLWRRRAQEMGIDVDEMSVEES